MTATSERAATVGHTREQLRGRAFGPVIDGVAEPVDPFKGTSDAVTGADDAGGFFPPCHCRKLNPTSNWSRIG